MSLNEADTRAKLIDPAIHKCGWTEDLIRREETAGTVEIINGKARRRARGKIDYVLRVKVTSIPSPSPWPLLRPRRKVFLPVMGWTRPRVMPSAGGIMSSSSFHPMGTCLSNLTASRDTPPHPSPSQSSQPRPSCAPVTNRAWVSSSNLQQPAHSYNNTPAVKALGVTIRMPRFVP